MEIELKTTVRHKGMSSYDSKDHHVTFGIYNEIARNGGIKNFVTIGVREKEETATIDITWEEFEKVYDMLASARMR